MLKENVQSCEKYEYEDFPQPKVQKHRRARHYLVMGKVSKHGGGWRKGLTAITMGGTAEQEGCGQDGGNSNYQRELLKPQRKM